MYVHIIYYPWYMLVNVECKESGRGSYFVEIVDVHISSDMQLCKGSSHSCMSFHTQDNILHVHAYYILRVHRYNIYYS